MLRSRPPPLPTGGLRANTNSGHLARRVQYHAEWTLGQPHCST